MGRFDRAFYYPLRHLGSSRFVVWGYQAICRASLSYVIHRLKKISQVQLVYLRRGMGKNECIPLLSDLDVTVVTSDEAGTAKVRAAISSLRKRIPMVEKQAFVLTRGGLCSTLEAPTFLTVPMYRLFEAQPTWRLLYTREGQEPADLTLNLNEGQRALMLLFELRYWHDQIIIPRHTSYSGGGQDFIPPHRIMWDVGKATLEIDNLCSSLFSGAALKFTRKEMVGQLLKKYAGTTWEALFEKTASILHHREWPAHYIDYVDTAFRFIMFRYERMFDEVRHLAETQFDFINRLRSTFFASQSPAGEFSPRWFTAGSVELDSDLVFEGLEGVFLTPQPETSVPRPRCLVLLLVRSFGRGHSSGVRKIVRSLLSQLVRNGFPRKTVEVHVVPAMLFLCMNDQFQLGGKTRCLFGAAAYETTLYNSLLDPNVGRERFLEIIPRITAQALQQGMPWKEPA